jgi:hypothetical protein
MCFKTRLIEECGKHLLENQTNVRDDVIPSKISRITMPSEKLMLATVDISQMTAGIRELSSVFRQMVEKRSNNTVEGE